MTLTTGQRWKLRRNLVIAVAHQHGLSQRLLADVFDLSRARVAAILADAESSQAPMPPRREIPTARPGYRRRGSGRGGLEQG